MADRPEFGTTEMQATEAALEARSRLNRAFRQSRQLVAIKRTGIDMQRLEYAYPQMQEVVNGYLSHIANMGNSVYEHQLVRDDNPLAPFFENLERRHR